MPALPPVAVEPDEPLRVRLLRFAGGAVLIVPVPGWCLVDHFTTSAYYENLLGSSGSYHLARCNPEQIATKPRWPRELQSPRVESDAWMGNGANHTCHNAALNQ